jgi:diaminohydroxyphosphoribosylaminopyrimidine deaminase/5-amino-6-(5-phosphoribosylamino)uracil reductase
MKDVEKSFMRRAITLAKRALGETSPNPHVGAVITRNDEIIGQGFHRTAGQPHAEIEAIEDAKSKGHTCRGASLFVTLEPCSTQGRTPACSNAVIAEGFNSVFIGTLDPNPKHSGRAIALLQEHGITVKPGILEAQCNALNEGFNYWIRHSTPLVTLKAGMTLDGKIATASGESKWITGEQSRKFAMTLRRQTDAIMVGVQTVLKDDPQLTIRSSPQRKKPLRRIVLDTHGRTPPDSKLATDEWRASTIVIISEKADKQRINALKNRVQVWIAPLDANGRIDLQWTLKELGKAEVLSLLVEGGGTVHGNFVDGRLFHKIAFFYAPKILGGKDSVKAVGGAGARTQNDICHLENIRWRSLGDDLLLTASAKDAEL